jgi:fibro-slime domain-containing protein
MKIIPVFLFALLVSANLAFPQTYPPTFDVPITFFDFHSDGSCPDFNPGTSPNKWLVNMVKDSLDKDGLPVRSDSLLYSYEVGKWFRPWRQGNDFERPVYAAGGKSLQSFATVPYDTSYKNVVIQQNLTFTYVPGSQGQYQFQSGMFVPLDNLGFGADSNTLSYNGTPIGRTMNPHNYSFTMHLRRTFKYSPGQSLFFQGDDDCWIFLNGRLVLDIGGIHNVTSGQFVLNNGIAYVWCGMFGSTDTTLAPLKTALNLGLISGATATMDIFYCERQAVGSDIGITSDIISAPGVLPPPQITFAMSVAPRLDTISAGDSITTTVTVFDDSGKTHPEYASLAAWKLAPAGTRSTLKALTGSSNVFHGVEAYKWYSIVATLADPANPGRLFIDTVKVYVEPGPADHLLIEGTFDSSISPNAENRLGGFIFPGTVVRDTVYAILRDHFGNFVGHAASVAWVSRMVSVVTVASALVNLGEGEITRVSTGNDSAYVVATQAAMKDSVQVILSSVTFTKLTYSQVRIGVLGSDDIDSLQIRAGRDTTLFARGLRSDGSGIWDTVPAGWWTGGAGLSFDNSPPAKATSWTLSPAAAGAGRIIVGFNSDNHPLFDSITVDVTAATGLSPHNAHSSIPTLCVRIPNAGIREFTLPPDVANAKLSFVLYSMSGKVVCKIEAINPEKPVDLNFSLQPGIYLVNIRASVRQIVKSRFVIVK